MVRDSPLPEPSPSAVAEAVTAVLDRAVQAVSPIEQGINAVYRVELADDTRLVLKAATVPTDAEFLPEPVVFERVDRETSIPVPAVEATVRGDRSPLGMAFYLAEYRDGRVVSDVTELDDHVHEQLVVESGHHLAALHDLSVGDESGALRVVDGELTVESPAAWHEYFLDLAGDRVGKLRGDGPLADDAARFADLAPAAEAAFGRFPTGSGGAVEPVVLHGDYRPGNLILANPVESTVSGGSPLVEAVVDVGGLVGDGLFDLAVAESSLIDVPVGGQPRAAELRDALRSTYLEHRPVDENAFDERYPYYRLYGLVKAMGAFDFFRQFAREDDPDAVADRWRSTFEVYVARC